MARTPVGQGRCRPRSLRGDPGRFELAPGQERQVVFRMGVGHGSDDARTHGEPVPRRRGRAQCARIGVGLLEADARRGAGGDARRIVNVLANGWLVYQTLACRMLGAQRVLPVGRRVRLPRPAAGRHGAHPRRAAAGPRASAAVREPAVRGGRRPALVASAVGRGVRTRCSDDYLWLPLATCRYVFATGDTGSSTKPRRFSKAVAVNPGTSPTTTCPAGQANPPRSTSIACAPCARVQVRRARPAADRGPATGTTA
jgi:cyclic beta-1,2-glucan synthetase